MPQWSLRRYSVTHLAAEPGEGVPLEAGRPSPTEVQVRSGSLVGSFSVFATPGGAWLLVGAKDLTVNRAPVPPFLRLTHGDVVCVGPVSAMVTDPSAIVMMDPHLVVRVRRTLNSRSQRIISSAAGRCLRLPASCGP